MKTLYFDCFAGISGDMLLGALCGLGVKAEVLQQGLQGLGLEGWGVSAEVVQRAHLAAWQVRVATPVETSHRHLADILQILATAQLSQGVRERASAIFQRLAEAEAKVHGSGIEQVHFHEVGAWDAIIDITGACLGFELLGVEHFVCSPLHVGTGLVKMAHGTFPVPPPAVAELLHEVPIYADGRRGELVTPTGAAIIRTVCQEYGPLPAMQVEALGYGAGSREYEDFPNVLRVWLGETEVNRPAPSAPHWETLVLLETNLDDLTPEVCGYVTEELRAAGALECYVTPVQMKKNRPGLLLSVLCRPAQAADYSAWLVRETGTLGVRWQEVRRQVWPRRVVTVDTIWGPVDVKVTCGDGTSGKQTGKPEYEQCRRYALAAGVSLREVQAAAWQAWQKYLRNEPEIQKPTHPTHAETSITSG